MNLFNRKQDTDKSSKKLKSESMENRNEKLLEKLKAAIDETEAVLIGAGSGLSVSAGFTYSGERFEKHFSGFIKKYHLNDMYSAGFYPFPTLEEYWAYWSRHIYYNRYDLEKNKVYSGMIEIVKNKDYFIITTNVDHQFQLAGFDKERLFYTQGDYGLWQCSVPCHQKTYDNEAAVRQMMEKQKDFKIPSELIPYCEKCGAPMTMNLRIDSTFVQDEGWDRASRNYRNFLISYKKSKILFLELGVGGNTPGIIKYPFWNMAAGNSSSIYACINRGESVCPSEIKGRSILLDTDIKEILEKLSVVKQRRI
jgi:hypothetical protein